RLHPAGTQFRRGCSIGQGLEGQGLKCVSGEDRGGLVEGHVHGGTPAAHVVVVHRRQVVVHQRVGVDQLDRGGRQVQAGFVGAQRGAGGVDQQRTHALAAAEGGVAHGRVQAPRFGGVGG